MNESILEQYKRDYSWCNEIEDTKKVDNEPTQYAPVHINNDYEKYVVPEVIEYTKVLPTYYNKSINNDVTLKNELYDEVVKELAKTLIAKNFVDFTEIFEPFLNRHILKARIKIVRP